MFYSPPRTRGRGRHGLSVLPGVNGSPISGRSLRSNTVKQAVAAVGKKLVGTLAVVAGGDLHRIAGVAQTDEIDALHHPARRHVEAGNDALGKAHAQAFADALSAAACAFFRSSLPS